MSTIAFVTYRDLPQLTSEDRSVCAYLQREGVKTRAVVWDEPAVAWGSYDAVVVRSCWDYHLRSTAFMDWLATLEQLQAPLWNPIPILRWNLHKNYLRDLQARGIAVPPTCWLERGTHAELEALLAAHGWREAVVKPAISATAHQTWRTTHTRANEDQQQFAGCLQQCDMLVQRFMEPVVDHGEWSLVFFQKQYSHAVLKQARTGDFRVQDDFGGTVAVMPPGSHLIEQAQQIVDVIEGPLLFARVDGIEQEGQLILMELELIEPYLFLQSDPQAVERFGSAILAARNSQDPPGSSDSTIGIRS
jgi:hypothetical protein